MENRRWIKKAAGPDATYREFLDPVIDEAERRLRERLTGRYEYADAEYLRIFLEGVTYTINFNRRSPETHATATPRHMKIRFNHVYIEHAVAGEGMFAEVDGEERFAYILDTVLHELAHLFATDYHDEPVSHGRWWRDVAEAVGAVPIGCTSYRKRLSLVRRNLVRSA